MTDFERIVRAYGEACRRSDSAAEMDSKLRDVLALLADGGKGEAVIARKLDAARGWIEDREHGDNCFVSDQYAGDPGARCNCGKDAILGYLESDTAPQAEHVDGGKGEAVANRWESLFDRVALELNCLPSSFVDDNGHVFDAIAKLRANTAPQAECARMEFMPVGGNDHMYVHGTREAIDALKARLEHDYGMRVQAECAPRAELSPEALAFYARHETRMGRCGPVSPSALETLYEVLMRRNIETGSEAYLTLRCVGVPPSKDEFVSAIEQAVNKGAPE